MQDSITAGQLLQNVVSGQIDSLTAEEYAILKHALERPLALFDEYEKALKEAKDKKNIGEVLTFRGANFKVAKHGATVAWKKAYDGAYALLSPTHKTRADDIVAGLRKPSKKLLAM